jgi:hypothetical protein
MSLLFFANLNNNTLLVTRLIGTEAEPCILVINANLSTPAGIFIHNNTTIYWTNFYGDSVFVGTVSGNFIHNQRQLEGGIFQFPNGISVDHINNKIYWANQERDIIPRPVIPPLVGHIYVADVSDIYITNPRFLHIPSDKLSGPNGVFVDYTQSPSKFYWTNYFGNTMYVGDLSDETVVNIQSIGSNLIAGVTVAGPSSIFIDVTTDQIYWTNYDNNTVFLGDLNGTVINNIQPITGPNFSGPNGVFLTTGTLGNENDPTNGACDPTCANCVRLFMQFSDLMRTTHPILDLQNSDDRHLLASALSLQNTYCFKIDWHNSSQMFGSAKGLLSILNASDSDLDPLMLDLKYSLLSVNKVTDCCDTILSDV